MRHFRVFDISASGHRIVLREDDDTFHVASLTDDTPAIDGWVESEHGGLGPMTLVDSTTGRSFDAELESVDCSLKSAIGRLQE
jgi:hypothetical protein